VSHAFNVVILNCQLPHERTQITVIHSTEHHSFRFSAIFSTCVTNKKHIAPTLLPVQLLLQVTSAVIHTTIKQLPPAVTLQKVKAMFTITDQLYNIHHSLVKMGTTQKSNISLLIVCLCS